MAIVTIEDVTLGWQSEPLLSSVNLTINEGVRLGLVGRNGSGKSTLLRLIMGQISPESGRLVIRDGARIAMMPQEASLDRRGSVFEFVAEALGKIGSDLLRLEADPAAIVDDPGVAWALLPKIEATLEQVGLPKSADLANLSGGERRRALLAAALVTEPDLLLLDEPTNHLDMETVEWLEGMLRAAPFAILFVTHDRAFLEALATSIVEIDRGRLRVWECGYQRFLQLREQALDEEEAEWARMDKRLAEEEAWARQGVKARRTRAVARVRALEELRRARAARREHIGKAKIEIAEAERSGKLVLEVEDLAVGYPGSEPLVSGLNLILTRGERIGIVGPNGSGKTTLLRTLLGELPPLSGTVRPGTKLEIVVLDQLREQLDESKTIVESVAEGADRVSVRGRVRHVIGYLQEFLFSPARARVKVGRLSGGERARLLLARLFLRPVNLLALDEPTNDLDLETLEVLEEQVSNLDATVLLISHDRAFLDAVCTSLIVLKGDGTAEESVGGYSDWVRQEQRRARAMSEPEGEREGPAQSAPAQGKRPPSRERLSYREERALESLPEQIEGLEKQQAELQERLQDPALYQGGGDASQPLLVELAGVEAELEAAMERWMELEEKAARIAAQRQ